MDYDTNKILYDLSILPLDLNEEFYMTDDLQLILNQTDLLDSFTFDYGASKLVLIPKDTSKKYVIKIPFNGIEDDIFDEDSNYWGYGYVSFEHSKIKKRPWDYCATEYYRYKIAKKYSFESYFAKTDILGYINNYPIYIQPKCTVFSKSNIDFSDKEREHTKSICTENKKKIIPINLNWLTLFKYTYGENELISFLKFLSKWKWNDDLRGDNLGILNGKPVIIDYSGYRE